MRNVTKTEDKILRKATKGKVVSTGQLFTPEQTETDHTYYLNDVRVTEEEYKQSVENHNKWVIEQEKLAAEAAKPEKRTRKSK